MRYHNLGDMDKTLEFGSVDGNFSVRAKFGVSNTLKLLVF